MALLQHAPLSSCVHVVAEMGSAPGGGPRLVHTVRDRCETDSKHLIVVLNSLQLCLVASDMQSTYLANTVLDAPVEVCAPSGSLTLTKLEESGCVRRLTEARSDTADIRGFFYPLKMPPTAASVKWRREEFEGGSVGPDAHC